MVLFDIATNFWSVMLSFEQMNPWYVKVCGCFDSKCRKLWGNIVITKDERVLNQPNDQNEARINSVDQTNITNISNTV